jgi:aminoglycoside phosphotransferase (APT) family kinase protein
MREHWSRSTPLLELSLADLTALVQPAFPGQAVVAPTDGVWGVTAMLDWEFAFSGSPFFDLGNLLRPPLGTLPGFATAVSDGYGGAGGRLSAQWHAMSQLADLLAWADFLNRPTINAALIADARQVIARTMALPIAPSGSLQQPAPAGAGGA